MIIAQITGGLGNQMFQYAGAKALALHLNTNLKLDLENYDREILPELEVPRSFELPSFKKFEFSRATLEEISSFTSTNNFCKKLQKFLPPHKRKVYIEKGYKFDKNFFKANETVYLRGHRQSEKYFEPYQNEIRNTYQIKNDLIIEVNDIGEQIASQISLSIHVRRGDYLRLPIILDWHGVLGLDYYKEAIKKVQAVHPNVNIYYFTDDIEWVSTELASIFPGTILSEEISKTHYHDFYLMSQCRHNIIANSSFSWWAAWLNNNPEKIVIAPKKWFNKPVLDTTDLIPKGWIRI